MSLYKYTCGTNTPNRMQNIFITPENYLMQLFSVHLTSGNHYTNFFLQRLDLYFLEFLLSPFAQHGLKIHSCLFFFIAE